MNVNTPITVLATCSCPELHTVGFIPVFTCRSFLSLHLEKKVIHVGLFCFPDGLIPVGTLDYCPFPSPFDFFLGVQGGEEDRLCLLFFLIVLEAARCSSSTLAFRGPLYAISDSFSDSSLFFCVFHLFFHVLMPFRLVLCACCCWPGNETL